MTASDIAADKVVVIPAYRDCILPFKLSFSMVGMPSLDTNPSRNANIDEPAATTTGPLVGASVVAPAPILTENCVALTFLVTIKLPSNGSPLNVVIPVLILTFELTLNP